MTRAVRLALRQHVRVASPAASGPYFDDLAVGDAIGDAPGFTLTEGHAAVHQAIVGDRLRLSLDAHLARDVLGHDGTPAHPGLVCDVAIGQSTLFTQRVKANLFYRGLALHRLVLLGDTLRTTTSVVALRENARRPDRAPTGLAVLRISTVDQDERQVLDFLRCAMLPLRDPGRETGHDADVTAIVPAGPAPDPIAALGGLDLVAYRAALPAGRHFDGVAQGDDFSVDGGDVVTSAPELARLTLNVAMVHHDVDAAGGRRLVYGGHTIGLAFAQITRMLPELVTVVSWEGCDHTGPVYEGDTLRSAVTVTGTRALPGGGGLVGLRSIVRAHRADGVVADVLDWRLTGVLA
jgi:acyl dehydratase